MFGLVKNAVKFVTRILLKTLIQNRQQVLTEKLKLAVIVVKINRSYV